MSFSSMVLASQLMSVPFFGRLVAGWLMLSPKLSYLFEKTTLMGLHNQMNDFCSQCNMLPGSRKSLKIRVTPAIMRSTHIGTGQLQAEVAIKIQVVDANHLKEYLCIYVVDRRTDPFWITFENYDSPRAIRRESLTFFTVDDIGTTLPSKYEDVELIKWLYKKVISMRAAG